MPISDYVDLKELIELPGEFVQTFNPKNIRAEGYPWFSLSGDGSAFCALFMDNLATQMSLAGVALYSFNFPAEFVWKNFFGGVGLSIFVGNFYYTLQASKIAVRTGRTDICAQPYGINTPGALTKSFSILGPVYLKTGSAQQAWETACLANFFGGVFEFLGAFIAPVIAKLLPQPAFLAPLGGVGMVYMGISSLVDMIGSHVANNPMVGFVPFVILWVAFYGSPNRALFGSFLPAAFVGLAVGMSLSYIAFTEDWEAFKRRLDLSTKFVKWQGLSIPGWDYASEAMAEHGSLVLGLAITNFVGTFACNISARKSGDLFPIMESMMVDGLGSMLGALCGSPYGTTVYIGHGAYKSLGATRGYSLVNGVLWLIMGVFGIHAMIDALVPHEIVLGILIAVGFFMSAQVVACSPRRWFPAVLTGMAISFSDYLGLESPDRDVQLLKNGYVIIILLYTILLIYLTDRWFIAAAGTFTALSLCTFFGLIHAASINVKYTEKGTIRGSEAMFETEGLPGWKLIVTYLLSALLCLAFLIGQKTGLIDPPEEEDYREIQARELEELKQQDANADITTPDEK